eukprot:m.292944 g.292944  ORF g.292944 m.292944 type:complete len:267 (-) comp20012_c0_seq4:169-969(-)
MHHVYKTHTTVQCQVPKINTDTLVSFYSVCDCAGKGLCYNSTGFQPPDYVCEQEELAFLRRREMLAAGEFLGAKNIWRCGFDDGMLISYHESMVRERISAFVRHWQPHVVITHFPYPNWDNPPTCNGNCTDVNKRWDDLGYHPDHKRVGMHVLNTCYGSGSAADNNKLFNGLFDAAGLRAWQAEELYFFAISASQPITHYISMDEDTIHTKSTALAKHHSQYPTPPEESVRWVGERIAEAVVERGGDDGHRKSSAGLFYEAYQAFF